MDLPRTASRAVPTAPDTTVKPEKNAGLIMGTNNSSIVSKRSVERLYLPEPHFFRYFVRKPLRRSPTINRGYWLRMRAVEHVVREFLERPTDQRKIVINLGCGYDPLPFQWLAREPRLCRNVQFVDVDYKALMLTKTEIIEATPRMRDLLTPQALPADGYTILNATEYLAIGCDLRDIAGLSATVGSLTEQDGCLVLCIAEVSVTYMKPDAADALIEWAANLSSDVTFCLLEQYLPDGADHPFAETMLKHFEKLKTPLRCVEEYPDLHCQTQRFFAAGFKKVKARNLWWLWSDPEFLSPSQRLALDKIEPFDEWEEFALFASHYLLVTAQVGCEENPPVRRIPHTSSASDVSARTASPRRQENQLFGLTYVENIPAERGRAHHGAAFAVEGGVAIAHHGGVGAQSRLSTTEVYGPPTYKVPTAKLPSARISPRSCHTITALRNGEIILVGGRASPAAAMRDCWIQRGQDWERIQDLPSPRYRHSAVPVILPGNVVGLIVFGGKGDQSRVHDDTLLWDLQTGWRCLTLLVSDVTPPTFGANMLALGPSHGFLFGGMRQDGMICHNFWRWRLGVVDEKVTGIAFTCVTASLDVSIGIHPYTSRFGATASIIGGSVLVIGGIASPGVIPRKYETLSITGDFLNSKSSVHDTELSVTAVEPDRQRSWPRPFLVGHSSVTTIRGNVLVVGGGAVCFSFGTSWNSGSWLIHDGTTRPATAWALLDPETAPSSPQPTQASSRKSETDGSLNPIARSTMPTADEIRNIVDRAVPRVFSSVNIGPCLNLWTLDYLKEKIGATRHVIVHHSASQNMDFHTKNFKYLEQSFGSFLDLAAGGAHLYLRSISSEKPARKPAIFAEDFPEIANDFQLPPEISSPVESFHSSALRISGDVNMWLHYDVMANFYCQVRGNRRFTIYPPSDITHLDFPPGSTTSRLGLLDSNSSPQFVGIPGTNPVEAVLKPGDVLFLPPLWPHTGAPGGGVSVAVNVFFRNLPTNQYAAGRDVYGNRDLRPYEDGRQDLEKIVKRFEHNVPADIAQAYLIRLADELKVRAAQFGP